MGATLPAIARWVETTPQGVSWLGFFYGGNIAGAVLGSLLAGFYLLRVYDMAIATYVAVALNVAVALARAADRERRAVRGARRRRARRAARARCVAPERWAVYVAIALSGLTALACRGALDAHCCRCCFGATVYTFSLILAVFLVGLGIGSSVGAALAQEPRAAARGARLGASWGSARAMAWTAWVLTESLPYWPINPSISTDAWFQFQLDLDALPVRRAAGRDPLGRELPAGAGRRSPSKDEDPARLVGGVYAANTLGAIVGSLGASLLLDRLDRQPARAAGADRRRGAVGPAAARGATKVVDRWPFAVATVAGRRSWR